jgi:serine/threonine protein kinase
MLLEKFNLMTANSNDRPIEKIIANRYKVIKTMFGGMGVIYLCVDTEKDDFSVALKTFKPEYMSDKNVRAQFLREATIWIELGWHPNIVQAYRTEYVPNKHEIYLVLEMLPSLSGKKDPSLRSWLTPGVGVSVEKTLKFILEITRGMKYATTKVPGLLHRDLKPENIYIGPDGSARITDFGLATVPTNILENPSSIVLHDKHSILGPGGTPYYMSPEQWKRRKVSQSSDIYSLGCIALEMLTGDFTIQGGSIKAIAEGHIKGGALKQLGKAHLPDALRAFFSKCLQPDSRLRFQTWENVEKEIIKLYDVLLNKHVEPENILIDVSLQSQILKGESLLAIGKTYLDIGEIQAAINCFEKARLIGLLQNYPELAASAEANIGITYFNLGMYECAISHYKFAIVQYMDCGNLESAILNYGNISNAYFRLGDFTSAQDSLNKVMEYTERIGDAKAQAFWMANLVRVISNSGNKRTALEYFLYALEVGQKYGDAFMSGKFLDVLEEFMSSWGTSNNYTLNLNRCF